MAEVVLVRTLPHGPAWHSYASGTSGSAISLFHGLRPSLHGALVVVATETVAMAMVGAAATAMREVALPRRDDAMPLCDAEKARVYASDNAGAGATAERLAAALRRGANENALRGALVMVATVAMTMTMAIAALPRRGDETTMCESDEAREYAADNAGASATAEQLSRTWATLCGRMGARALLGSLNNLEGREEGGV